MTITAKIYEMEYSCSPGGEDCWEIDVNNYCYSDFKTAGDAVKFLLDKYPYKELQLTVQSLNWHGVAFAN